VDDGDGFPGVRVLGEEVGEFGGQFGRRGRAADWKVEVWCTCDGYL